MKKLFEQYLQIEKEIFEYFEYQEDWVRIPIDNDIFNLNYEWAILGPEDQQSEVIWHSKLSPECISEGNYFGGTIYTQRFLPKWVYRGKEYTMICVDTHTDGNKYLMIFDNSKEIKDLDI